MQSKTENWSSGDPYEYFMGRWSRQMAPVFLDWLRLPGNLHWLDVGCGTGALSEAILIHNSPASIHAVDPSAKFLEKAEERLGNQVIFKNGGASDLPLESQSCNVVVSGLALNFFPNIDRAFSEMKRVLKPGGTLAAYVWDYAGRMELLRIFWDAAVRLDPAATKVDEGIRFRICNIRNLQEIFLNAGLIDVKASNLDILTVFHDFDDYWNPFLGGQGPAPGYFAGLDPDIQEKLKTEIRERLPLEKDGSIHLMARAIGIRGTCMK
ncbi:MAG TPA: methyltransferase domain-containing protein [Bacteroidia bacterium]|nr:methyltransferase domain-containing protein [Bacteroidia bacterium]